MAKIIEGDDLIIVVDGKPTLHATSHKLDIEVDIKEIRTKDTDGTEIEAGDVKFSGGGDGLVCIKDAEDTGEGIDSQDLIDLVLAKGIVEIVTKCNLTGSGMKSYTGKAMITSLNLSGSTGEKSTYSYSFKGSGGLKKSTL